MQYKGHNNGIFFAQTVTINGTSGLSLLYHHCNQNSMDKMMSIEKCLSMESVSIEVDPPLNGYPAI
jgi:hypothetical protein